MTAIAPIETRYKGYRFRSRLEARWAVFFDALGLDWEYEPEGFQTPSGRLYLPDFYLPRSGTWVEVKGAEGLLDYQLLEELIDFGGYLPHVGHSEGSERGLLVLGNIPNSNCWPVHSLLQHNRGVIRSVARFTSWLAMGVQYVGGGDSYWQAHNAAPLLREECLTVPPDPKVEYAYRAARSARFEHGESG